MSKLKINYISVTVNVNYQDESEKEPVGSTFTDSISLNFHNESELNRAIKEKPHFAEVVPILLKKLAASHDPENKDAKKLLKDLGQ